MRHRVYGKHLGRDKNQRTALFRGLVRSLILHQSIQTTETKVKAIKGLVDKLISAAKKKTPASLKVVNSYIPDNEISKKLVEEIAPAFKDRSSGFTNTVRLGTRAGDGAMMTRISLINDKDKEVKKEKKLEVKKGKE